MSRTRRCAPEIEAGLVSLVVAPSPATGFVATATVRRPVGPEHDAPVVVVGEGETVARATGAAMAAAWRLLHPRTEAPAAPAGNRRQLELAAQEDG